MADIILKITGMTCNGCVKSVTRVLEELDGVENVQVSLSGSTNVVFDESKVSIAQLIEAIEDAGFEVEI